MNSGIPVIGQHPCKAQKQEKTHWKTRNQFLYSHHHIFKLAQCRAEREPVSPQIPLQGKESMIPLIDPDTSFAPCEPQHWAFQWTSPPGLPKGAVTVSWIAQTPTQGYKDYKESWKHDNTKETKMLQSLILRSVDLQTAW